MKKIAFLTFLLLNNFIFAETYFVESVVELTHDLSARRKVVSDRQGKGCALVRVSIPSVNGISFGEPVIGTPEYLPGEYSIYLPENTPKLSFVANGVDYVIDFAKFNIIIEEKKCYRVVVKKESHISVEGTKTRIDANYDNVVILIDGVPVGQTPLELSNIPLGKHVLSVPNTIGVTMKDTTIVVSANNNIRLFLYPQKREKVSVDFAGGESSYNVFGTNVIEKKEKQGVIDYTGKTIVPCKFDYIYPSLQNGYYVVEQDDKDGLYEPEKGLVVPCIYDGIITNHSYEHKEVMPVYNYNKNGDQVYGALSPSGKPILPLIYERVDCGTEAIIVSYKKPRHGEVFGACSLDGQIIAQPAYSNMCYFVKGYALFEKPDKTIGLVDVINGKEKIIPSKYKLPGHWRLEGYETGGADRCHNIISSGLFRVVDKETGKYGFMNTKPELVIPTIYDFAENFYGNVTLARTGKDWVLIDNKGKTVINITKYFKDVCIIQPKWDDEGIIPFYEEDPYPPSDIILFGIKTKDDLFGILDTTGKIVVPFRQDDKTIWFREDGKNYFILYEENELVIQDQDQNVLYRLPSNITILKIKDGFIQIWDEDSKSYGYLNIHGEVLANCIYGYNSDSMEEESEKEKEESEDSWESLDSDEYQYTLVHDHSISEGLAVLNIGDRYGFIDNLGNVKVPLIYTAVTPFENGVSYVRTQNGKWKKIFKGDL